MTSEILFPAGMRLTTWVCLAVFVALAVRRRQSAPLAAALVWLLGFEAAFDISREAAGYGHMVDRVAMIAIGVFTVAWFTRQGVRPSMPWLYATAAIWVVWLADGFPANMKTTVGFDWKTEVLNVAAKTTLAVAYFLPLARSQTDAAWKRPWPASPVTSPPLPPSIVGGTEMMGPPPPPGKTTTGALPGPPGMEPPPGVPPIPGPATRYGEPKIATYQAAAK